MRIIILLIILLSPRAWAIDIEFGPEFTFGRLDDNPPDVRMMQGRMDVHLIRGQEKGAKFRRKVLSTDPAVRYYSPNGWNATVDDDQGVIEVQMKPMTVELFEHFKNDIQDAIFASAANIDHWPLLWRGGGHINLSFSTFKNNPLLFRNFIVDCYNHNELFMGAFGYDTHNAMSWNVHPARRAGLEKTIELFDHGNYFSAVNFAEDLEKNVNVTDVEPVMLWGTEELRIQKEFAINFIWVREGRLEIRAVRPQASVDVWVRQIRLIKKRLEYLEKLKEPLAIDPKVEVQPIDLEKHMLEPPVNPQDAMKAFYTYVTEAGEDWADHRDYLWPKWGWDGEIKKFEKSYWFKKRQSEKCEKRLAGAK